MLPFIFSKIRDDFFRVSLQHLQAPVINYRGPIECRTWPS